MKSAATKKLPLLPFTASVRRAALFAGILFAIFTGGFPFVGYGPAFAMGRFVPLVSPFAFLLHLLLGIVYGAVLSLAIGRSRGRWTCFAALAATVLLYLGNLWLMRAWDVPPLGGEVRAVAAHLVFVCAFTLLFKLREADTTELSMHHARAR